EEARAAEEEQRKKAETYLYFNRIVLAEREWGANNASRARQLLQECSANRGRWEWGYLNRLFQQELRTFRHPTSVVLSVAVSPEGKWIACSTDDKTVKIWDAATGAMVTTLPGHTVTVAALAFSSDGRHLASGGPGSQYAGPGEVKLWDVAAWRERSSLKGIKEPVHKVAFSQDGQYLAACSGEIGGPGGAVITWDVKTCGVVS